jgi:hypothetical protein
MLPPGLPRPFALNGEPSSCGSCFAKYDQPGLALAVMQLNAATAPGKDALTQARPLCVASVSPSVAIP